MELFCNGESAGNVEHVEWKDEDDEGRGGTVTFMVSFDFDWEAGKQAFLELAEDADTDERYMLSTISRVDEGGAGDFVVARYKPLG